VKAGVLPPSLEYMPPNINASGGRLQLIWRQNETVMVDVDILRKNWTHAAPETGLDYTLTKPHVLFDGTWQLIKQV